MVFLPVLPFVFSRADQPFRRSALPLLLGMSATFSLVAAAAAFGGHWVVRLNQGGRYVAMAIFLVLGVSLLFPAVAEWFTRPLVRFGGRLQGGPSNRPVRALHFCWEFPPACSGPRAPALFLD